MSDAAPVMEEREEPRFVKFTTGDVVEGVLSSLQRVTIGGKLAVKYIVQEDGGQYVQFIGTHQLNTKLRITDRGHRVEIRCEGEDTMVKKGDNCMKVFKVLVSRDAVAASAATDPLLITDDDIPF
jgi:hypothetical protein